MKGRERREGGKDGKDTVLRFAAGTLAGCRPHRLGRHCRRFAQAGRRRLARTRGRCGHQCGADASGVPNTGPRRAASSSTCSASAWARRKAGETPRPVLFLVHGSSVSARPSFDLAVPGAGEYSLMNVFARYGFDVWTMDHEGYGRSTAPQAIPTSRAASRTLKAGGEVVERETGQQRFHFYRRILGRACAPARSPSVAPETRGAPGARGLHLDRQGLADARPSAAEQLGILPHAITAARATAT